MFYIEILSVTKPLLLINDFYLEGPVSKVLRANNYDVLIVILIYKN